VADVSRVARADIRHAAGAALVENPQAQRRLAEQAAFANSGKPGMELNGMNPRFVPTGPIRFVTAKESGLWQSIEKKYAGQLASASWLKRQRIKVQMQREFFRRRKEGHKPSPGTLW